MRYPISLSKKEHEYTRKRMGILGIDPVADDSGIFWMGDGDVANRNMFALGQRIAAMLQIIGERLYGQRLERKGEFDGFEELRHLALQVRSGNLS